MDNPANRRANTWSQGSLESECGRAEVCCFRTKSPTSGQPWSQLKCNEKDFDAGKDWRWWMGKLLAHIPKSRICQQSDKMGKEQGADPSQDWHFACWRRRHENAWWGRSQTAYLGKNMRIRTDRWMSQIRGREVKTKSQLPLLVLGQTGAGGRMTKAWRTQRGEWSLQVR